MKKFTLLNRFLALLITVGLAVGAVQAPSVHSSTINKIAQAAAFQAQKFDGKALYNAVFQALRDRHIMLQDPVARAKWVSEWERKHDADGLLNSEDSADMAILEMIGSLNQRFDYYLRPESTRAETQQMDPSLIGIGASLTLKGADRVAEQIINALPKDATRAQRIEAARKANQAFIAVTASAEHPVVVVQPIEGGPAEKAGVLANDHIIKVNGKTVFGKKLQEIVDSLSGKEGDVVQLTIERIAPSGDKVEKIIAIKRAKVVSHVVHYKDLGNGLSYIKLDNFGSRFAAKEMHDALEKAVAGKALVLDLRNNPGGRLDLVNVITSFFLKEGTIIELRARNGDDLVNTRLVLQPTFMATTEQTKSAPESMRLETDNRPTLMLPEDMPVVVLVNKGSASASEILSGALQANHRAVIVGVPTYGKGVGQIIVQLPFGRSIHVTNFEFLPGGKPMDWIGILPDIRVAQPESDTTGGSAPVDAQLETANQVAIRLIQLKGAIAKERQLLLLQNLSQFSKSHN